MSAAEEWKGSQDVHRVVNNFTGLKDLGGERQDGLDQKWRWGEGRRVDD